MYNNHFAVHLKLTQHCKSTILQLKKKRERDGQVVRIENNRNLKSLSVKSLK